MSRSSNIITVDNYRALDRLSYSALSTYVDNRLGFYMEYILKDEDYLKKKADNKEENQSLKMGTLIDCLQTDEDNYESLYYESEGVNPPAPQMERFCRILYKECKDGGKFSDCLVEAYEKLRVENLPKKLQSKFPTFVKKFEEEGQAYFDEMLKAGNRTVITKSEYDVAKKAADKAKYCKPFRDIGEVYTKLVILFEYAGHKLKCEIDKISIDHSKKIIYLIDYKTSYDLENFIWIGYLKRNYYIQASLYKYALIQWAEEHYPGYTVDNMQFRVMDITTKNLDPLVYKTSGKMYENGFTGFYVGKKYYKGIDQILDEISESIKIDNWAISIENHKNENVVLIPDFNSEMNDR